MKFSIATLTIVASARVVRGTGTTHCCDGDENCCPTPSIGDLANGLRVVLDKTRCCPGPVGALWCAPYGVVGCSFCKDECDTDDDECVQCDDDTPTPTPAVLTEQPFGGTYNSPDLQPDDNAGGKGSVDDDGAGKDYHEPDVDSSDGDSNADSGDSDSTDSQDAPHPQDVVDDDVGVVTDWSSEFPDVLQPGSYDFSYEFSSDYDCSACSWENMSVLEQRLLKERSRSLICDSSCLTSAGHDAYGVHLCNYFNAGKECRACCHVSGLFLSTVQFITSFFVEYLHTQTTLRVKKSIPLWVLMSSDPR